MDEIESECEREPIHNEDLILQLGDSAVMMN